ncbi:hypothetical protein [Mucilaginibacter auburnensis]|uniref:Lipoprotein n=1 Tax=Mucilaginibacter auburnensis TaxID=1457233 RepID=A0A2H9VMU4_9SPHI|nr:hypothetical protein [Mucilaginibacter auburnensis]PJJ79633.1 hypothetical protein CLV57_2768 [Mucilaginibacter auburnensis]
MKTKFFALIVVASLLAACSSNRNTIPESSTDTTTSAPLPKTTTAFDAQRDGSSFERAIVINEKNETNGVQAENLQLSTLYPGYKRLSQRYEDYKGKQHEVVSITAQDGREIAVYFDVSNYFGKQ